MTSAEMLGLNSPDDAYWALARLLDDAAPNLDEAGLVERVCFAIHKGKARRKRLDLTFALVAAVSFTPMLPVLVDGSLKLAGAKPFAQDAGGGPILEQPVFEQPVNRALDRSRWDDGLDGRIAIAQADAKAIEDLLVAPTDTLAGEIGGVRTRLDEMEWEVADNSL